EVHRPHLVGPRRLGEMLGPDAVRPGPAPALLAQAVSAQRQSDGALVRRLLDPVDLDKQIADLLWAPGRMLDALLEYQRLHRLRGGVGALLRPAAAVRQALASVAAVALEVLVPSLAADAEVSAQLAHCKSPCLG